MLKNNLNHLMGSLQANDQINYNFAIESEEATKSVAIEPFFQILGYKTENFADFRRQVTINNGHLFADYGIYFNSNLTIVIQIKKLSIDLNTQDLNPLKNLFNQSTAQFGILTNGLQYKFYTYETTSNEQTMNDLPFFTFNLESFDDNDIKKLESLKRDNFNPNTIIKIVEELNILQYFKKVLLQEIETPSIELVKFFMEKSNYPVNNIEKYKPILKNTMEQVFLSNNQAESNTSFKGEQIMSGNNTSTDYTSHFNVLGSNNLKKIMNNIRDYIFSLNPNIIEKSPQSYITYKFKTHFLRFFTQTRSIVIYLRLSDYEMVQYKDFGDKLPDGHRHGQVQFSVQIRDDSNLDKIKEMIKVSYEYAKR